MSVWAVIQARLSSRRLPGKALHLIEDHPMAWHVVTRIQSTAGIDGVVLAITTATSDNPLSSLAADLQVPCFRGSEEDVLDRTYKAGLEVGADVLMRVSSDCPFTDPIINSRVLRAFSEGHYDYASNVHPPTFPDGLDVEVVRMDALRRAWSKASLRSEREHVTPFIWKQPDMFRLFNVMHDDDLSALRWTVDEKEDLAFVQKVYAELYTNNPAFGMYDVLALVEKDHKLSKINSSINRNDGYLFSIKHDRDEINVKSTETSSG